MEVETGFTYSDDAVECRKRFELGPLGVELRRVVRVQADDSSGTLVMRRSSIVVACNLGREEQKCDLGGGATLLLSSGAVDVELGGAVRLGPDAVAVLRSES